MTVVEGTQFGSRGRVRVPAADDVLVAAVGLVLKGAGLPEAIAAQNGRAAGIGFLAVPVAGAAHLRVSVTWHEDGEPSGGLDAPAGELHACERAFRRAGFHVEMTTEAAGRRLLAWRRLRTW